MDVEAELVETLIRCKVAGVGINGHQLPKIVSRIAVSLGKKDASWLPEEGWLSRFWDRNHALTVKLGGKIGRGKAEEEYQGLGGPGGSSILAAGFRDAGLVPFNPAIFTEESFAASDALLGFIRATPPWRRPRRQERRRPSW